MIAVLVSGGKDSTATLLVALERFPKERVIPIFTDTGWESSITYAYLNYLETKLSIEIVRLKSRKWQDLLTCIKEKKMFPHGNQRFCTYHLKLIPTAEFLAEHPEIEEVWLGIRASESFRREKKYGDLTPEDTYSYVETATGLPAELRQKIKHLRARLPIVDWTEEEVFRFLKEKGIERNPLYDMGHSRVGCYPCILGGLREWKACWKTEEGRANILKLIELEKELREMGYNGRIKDNYDGEKLLRLLKMEDVQGDLFKEETCEFCKV
ncbi:phosphoadenosine phosphosulfate reductase [Hydrogenobacter thermophilus TK-6]|uniref:Phosphoadenosine phosphosulfate reductase n=1 Tax=Hydrogenobacter thermophilus (strain DSM 6534 / IAM 12695 / TK-6) TaxID=608538 RepID=D3DGP3_HYDTT|nr:phosphoadenosine phosphosulfate reductase family protein [Hydrogenobacter thermophilus]ADO44930.1 phosphoadenosine phosphosulfate reductase [Hydrogenobacter thermophilus TK-6]BAI68995.1 phosphoadenosine phosphosulfate reductase [Hydrogenobacter thermophilus TK-6]